MTLVKILLKAVLALFVAGTITEMAFRDAAKDANDSLNRGLISLSRLNLQIQGHKLIR